SSTRPGGSSGTSPWSIQKGSGGFAAGGFGGSGGGFKIATSDGTFKVAGFSSTEKPAIVTTQAIDAATQSQLKEDLSVMDKLLRDELSRVGGDPQPRAMGIALRFAGDSSPMYVESCG